MNGIQLQNVSKSYGDIRAADNVTLTLEENKIYGLLGRNGAGKSTLLNIVSNRIFPDSGQVLIDGACAAENDSALCKLYLMSEKTLYPEGMKVKDALYWSGQFYTGFDMQSALSLANLFGLNIKKNVKSLSTGYKSIFKIVVALSVNVPYVLLDEPVLGLDANHRELFYKLLLEKYSEKPFTAVISTHLIEEVASVIENIVILKSGRVIKDESCQTLLSGGYAVSGTAQAVQRYAAGKQVLGTDSLGGLKTAYILGKPEPNGLPQGLELSALDLQKLFVQLTNV